MVSYKIIKYCRLCKKRFVVNKGQKKKNYCTDCQEKWRQSRQEQGDEKK